MNLGPRKNLSTEESILHTQNVDWPLLDIEPNMLRIKIGKKLMLYVQREYVNRPWKKRILIYLSC